MEKLGGSFGFARTLTLLLTGSDPSRDEAEMVDALLVSAADHGPKAPSAHVALAVSSTRASLSASVAAGLLTLGDVHGGAAGKTSAMLLKAVADGKSAPEVITEAKRNGLRIPGFGHRLYREADPRSLFLMRKASELGLAGPCCTLARDMVREIPPILGKSLVLNIDGAHGAILADMGWSPDMCEALFITARTAGLCAHVIEDRDRGKPLQFLTEVQKGEDLR
jgi:citrate synthase